MRGTYQIKLLLMHMFCRCWPTWSGWTP